MSEHAPDRATPPPVDRRTLLRGAGGVVAATWLVACGGDDETASAGSTSTTPAETTDGGGGGGGVEALASTSDVEVGGGVIVAEEFVVTQPVEGEFKAFTAICIHQGCVLGEVVDNTIMCSTSCGHGSQFSAEDGSVVQGPAAAPLAEQPITVKGDEILLA